jgi:uncharacterized protein
MSAGGFRDLRGKSAVAGNATLRMIGCSAVAAGLMLPQLAAADGRLADLIRHGDAARAHELVRSGSNVNATAGDGSSPLLWAVYQSDLDLIHTLVTAGADVNAANRLGMTPLLQASRTGDAPVIAALLAAGADLEAAEFQGETPLMAAARAGSVEAVSVLLERGSDPNAVESTWHQTALMWAAAEGHVEVVDALLKAGADPNIRARETELTRRSTRVDFPTGGFTALMWAARNGDEAVVRRLLDGGADINVTNGDGATPMMLAIINDRFDFAAKLLELGADPNDGSLYRAVEMRDATTDWLAKDGTQLRANHPNELTALDMIRLLLEAGADPNQLYTGQMHSASMCCDTFEHGTPFFRAAVAADVEAMKLLIAHGADLEWTQERVEGRGGPAANRNVGKTPVMVAMDGGKGVGMAGGPGDIREGRPPPFREEANRDPADAVRLLLESGADPDAVTPDRGESALHLAAKSGKLDIIQILADAGATLDLPNGEGETALAVVEKMPPRDPPPPAGALAGTPQGAQPAEVAEFLRELMGIEAFAQARLSGGGDAQ